MSQRARVTLGVLGILLLISVALFFFLRYQVRKSFPVTSGRLPLAVLQEPVEVARDRFGVPVVRARTTRDAITALGFVHAQERLWQMDMSRRVGEGRLSELFGEATVPYDRMFRIVGIKRISEEIERQISVASRERLQWYADGVNAFIESNRGKYPVEFDMLRYDPEPWIPLHSIIIGRLMAWELNLSWWADLTLGAIVERVGLEKAVDIFPSYPADVAPLVKGQDWRRLAGIGSDFLKTARAFREIRGSNAIAGGSNAWALAPSKSASGKVILANDTHLHLQNPSKWYEVYIQSPDYHVGGMSIPGVPGVVAGENDSIAWGITNLMADDADFYVVQLDEHDSTRYYYDGKWLRVETREEEIAVRGEDPVPVLVRSTHHGPIITDIKTDLTKASYPYVAAMRWTGTEINDQIEAFYRINRAKNWTEFSAAVSTFSGPGQNFVYGDSRGNIGYRCGVLLPIRGKQTSTLPLPGWDPAVEWKGFVPFEKLPFLFNPPEGYIASANNKLVEDSFPYHITDLWEPPSRILRLRDQLEKGELFSSEDCERLQNDTYSQFASELMPHILAAWSESPPDIPERDLVFEYLTNWNYHFLRQDIATTIFHQFYVQLLENIFRDEMGEELFHDFVILGNIPLRVTSRLIAEGTSPWFDNVTTEHVETRNDIIRASVKTAVDALRERLGSEPKAWRWGELHTVTLQHPFGLQKPLDKIFNIGPFPCSGGQTTLMSNEYSFNTPFAVTVGASFRRIFDFGRPDETRSILTSGQSGHVFHRNFDDQTQLWLNGAYRTVSRRDVDTRDELLILIPVE